MARKDDRLDDEMAFHLEQQAAKLMRAGVSEAEARRAARLKFGGVVQVREATRDEMRGAWLRDFARDLRIAFRGWRGAGVLGHRDSEIGIARRRRGVFTGSTGCCAAAPTRRGSISSCPDQRQGEARAPKYRSQLPRLAAQREALR